MIKVAETGCQITAINVGASSITKHNNRLLQDARAPHFFQDRIPNYANTTHPVMFNETQSSQNWLSDNRYQCGCIANYKT
jgi:hypothetical protein